MNCWSAHRPCRGPRRRPRPGAGPALATIAALAAGCGPAAVVGATGDPVWDERSVLRAVYADLYDLAASRPAADSDAGRAFAQAFGHEADGGGPEAFVRSRVGHFALESWVLGSSLELPPSGWPEVMPVPDAGPTRDAGEGPGRLLGHNTGSLAWVDAKVQGRDPFVTTRQGQIDFDDPRHGLVVFPDHFFVPAGVHRRPRVARWLRQSVIVHEARHSDCGEGGLSPAVAAARLAHGPAAYTARNFPRTCGYWHVPCEGGEHDGILACDRMPWGANGFGLVVLHAARARGDLSRAEQDDLDVLIEDVRSRLVGVDTDALVRGALPPPDLSHSPRVKPGVQPW